MSTCAKYAVFNFDDQLWVTVEGELKPLNHQGGQVFVHRNENYWVIPMNTEPQTYVAYAMTDDHKKAYTDSIRHPYRVA